MLTNWHIEERVMHNHIFTYHKNLAQHFKKQQKTWDWFSNVNYVKEEIATFKQALLKHTYRLSPDSEANIYKLIEQAKTELGIQKNVIVYQELNSFESNARVFDISDDSNQEINIIISGKLLSMLTQQELLAVFAHELSHIVFYQLDNGDYDVTSRIIRSIANDPRSSDVMLETARLYQLYIELFCDRGALQVVKNMDTVIEALVKVGTGLNKVSAKNYLKQAHEIFAQAEQIGNTGSSQYSHPETFIRARALQIVQNKEDDSDDDRMICSMIDANWSMNKLDIFKQASLQDTTKTMLQLMCKPKWMQTQNVLALCRQYFPRFVFAEGTLNQGVQTAVVIEQTLEAWFDNVDDSIREYFSYVLLDFCYTDSSLELAPIGHAFTIAEALNFHKTFRQILKKERKITVKKLDAMIAKAVAEVSELSEGANESVLVDE